MIKTMKRRVTTLVIYEGADKALIDEEYKRDSFNRKLKHQERKTMFRLARTDKKSKEYLKRADHVIEAINDEFSEISAANSEFRNAVNAIDDACIEPGIELTTSASIDMMRLEMMRERDRKEEFDAMRGSK